MKNMKKLFLTFNSFEDKIIFVHFDALNYISSASLSLVFLITLLLESSVLANIYNS